MITIEGIEGLNAKLTVLDVAREQLQRARDREDRARYPYQLALDVLTDAMRSDQTVIDTSEDALMLQEIFNQAEAEAHEAAVLAVKQGHTHGKKQWNQSGWSVRVRDTLTPVVDEYRKFMAHLDKLDAHSIVKSVKVVFNREMATKLFNTVAGIDGMHVDERTTVSLTKQPPDLE